MLQKQFYFLSPVEVVKVTSQNLLEVAEWCGGKVAQAESRRVKDRMDSYVWVPTPEGSKISWAFPGMFVTKRIVITAKNEIHSTFAVFRRDYFEKNYWGSPSEAVDATWERAAEEEKAPKKHEPVEFKNNVGDALERAMASHITVNVFTNGEVPEDLADQVSQAVVRVTQKGTGHEAEVNMLEMPDPVKPYAMVKKGTRDVEDVPLPLDD